MIWKLEWWATKLRGWRKEFGSPSKIAAHIEVLLEIKFLHSPTKSLDGSPFDRSTGVALIAQAHE